MEKKVTCFIAAGANGSVEISFNNLKDASLSRKVYVVASRRPTINLSSDEIDYIQAPSIFSTEAITRIAASSNTPYTLICVSNKPLKLGHLALERLVQVADDTATGILYTDYFVLKDGRITHNPVNEYLEGSLRDDFNFGPILFFNTAVLKTAVSMLNSQWHFAGLYDLRLTASRIAKVIRLPEPLFTEMEIETKGSHEVAFDYVDPKNRAAQLEMEQACNSHLKALGAWLKPVFKPVNLSLHDFPVEASVIIPVRDRVNTIRDAVKSALSQEADFKFNIICVDNHSTDGTSEALQEIAKSDARLVHVIPDRADLGIGGCWNVALSHPLCGRFAIQLDSDDLYIDNKVIATVVAAFYTEECAMVVGSYKLVDFDLNELPPGLIDHREWTPDNGRNNALRVNGFGAPRAFYTPVLREARLPNTSYGEDYAAALRISRIYNVGRIYEPLYLCRRWQGNSDSALDVSKLNLFNHYKDKIRTIELMARINFNKQAGL